ncbi:DUF905 family protein [Cronobacter sakazakii]|uniref:DUF905 family protein n=1 Tax=Enterobacteriaceae TaxID=543 RepID=UPI00044D35EE|nr:MULTISPECIES: DUF905 family protein [Enterobacter]ECM7320614.1 DUF905 domain-containing protein [Salmonella enterica subsp. enterica serovar Enteritidis]EFN0763415.1 DUF905 domain-containing protein [Escherichia coli]KAB1466710.1 DUF905 domain-containing protein [Cronobacter sakazakii]MCU3542868.1 DUF905 domain-containing protein [Enterobacter hormaechei subsp. steigerwaltii]HAT4519996.1 DUF905 domain-containing protein [Serratia marcescens]
MAVNVESVIRKYKFSEAVTIKIANVSKYNDKQVEIRDAATGRLIWRAWDFEPSFLDELEKQIKPYVI